MKADSDVFESLVQDPSPRAVKVLCKGLFDVWLTDGQAEIVYNIVFGPKKFAFVCPTRYGKTVAVAVAMSLYIVLYRGQTITILSNKNDNCEKIRDRFIRYASNCPDLLELLSAKSKGVERLKQEISKREIKLRDGTHIQMQPAGNVSPDALDGLGGDLIIEDESDNIPDENHEKGVRRMLGDSPNTQIVQSGNATLRNTHFYEAMMGDEYDSLRIDWRQAVAERYGPDGDRPLTRDFVMGEKKALPSSHFKSMYLCEFPEQSEAGLIGWHMLKQCRDCDVPIPPRNTTITGFGGGAYPYRLYGLDVAREGRDRSVLTCVDQWPGFFVVKWQEAFDTADSTRLVELVEQRLCEGYSRVNVDSHGMGGPVVDQLRGNGVYAVGVKVGVSKRSALSRPDDFQDLKAEFYDKVRRLFEAEDVYFSAEHSFDSLFSELAALEVEYNTRNKLRVVDPNKSPDFADSLMLAVSVDGPRSSGSIGSTTAF